MESCRGRIVAVVVAFLGCVQVNAQDWPQFRGSDGDGKSLSVAPAKMMFFNGDKNSDGFIDEEERQALQGEMRLDASKTLGREKAANRPVRPAS